MSQPIIDAATLKRFTDYSNITGVPLDQAVTEALSEWMDMVGEVVLTEFIRRSRTSKRKNSSSVKKTVAKPTSHGKVMDIRSSSRQFRANNASSTTSDHFSNTRRAAV